MVKLVDTLVSGTSDRKVVQVRVLFRALKRVRNSSLFYLLSVGYEYSFHDSFKGGNMGSIHILVGREMIYLY